MLTISPLTKKRFRAFRRIRRAWWSLIGLCGIFLFCTAVVVCDVVRGRSPSAVVNPATLEAYREAAVERTYDVRTARFSVDAAGSVFDFEGPDDVRARIAAGTDPAQLADEFDVRSSARDGYTRWYLDPLAPAAATETVKEAPPISYPFRPCKKHWFGIDSNGFDVYTRVVWGMFIALVFGLVLAFSGMLIGLVIGSVEGYFGGVTDIICQRLTEIWSALPFLYVMIFIGSALGHGLSDFQRFMVLLLSYAIFNWISVSYYMRAEFLRLRSRTFVEAAKCQGFSASRIIFGHILPNALTPLITLFPFLLMGAIGSLASLDFLGFGLPPMSPSCGELLRQAQTTPSAWWLILFPSLALFVVMLLTVLVGEGLRDAFDPRQKSKLE
ncbi:MAG: ABC transporter permease subunit [Kiritimatiellae bacterium]|nr:ABC transporter permease subunit [Kiritimatiellia bacterium]